MEKLRDYIAFDLEFNQHEGVTHLIQVSAVRFQDGQESAAFDSYVYTTAPLKSFINGLTGITAETLKDAPPILLEHGLDYRDQYKVDLYDEAFERRSSDLHGIANLKLQTVANFLGFKGQSHNSLEDARMTARVYEAFLESDEGKLLIEDQSSFSMNNPFGSLDLSQFLD